MRKSTGWKLAIIFPGSYPKPDVGVCRNMEEYSNRLSIPER